MISMALPFTRQAVSKHLAVLQESGLIDNRGRAAKSITQCGRTAGCAQSSGSQKQPTKRAREHSAHQGIGKDGYGAISTRPETLD